MILFFYCLIEGFFFFDKKVKKWQAISNNSLQQNINGDYDFLDLGVLNDQLVVVLKSGVYYLDFNKLKSGEWKKLKLGFVKADDFTEGFTAAYVSYDLDVLMLYLANFRGEVYELVLREEDLKEKVNLNSEELSFKAYTKADLMLMLDLEPSIQDLHEQALKFAAIPTGSKLRSYRLKARLRNLLPDLNTYFDNSDASFLGTRLEGRDEFSSKESSIKTSFEENIDNLDDNEFEFGFNLSWKFGNLLYDPELMDIVNGSRIIANVREKLTFRVKSNLF